jgi:hypothetical protein
MNSSHQINKLRKRLAQARRILECYSSPFPDREERRKREAQRYFVETLERQLNELVFK